MKPQVTGLRMSVFGRVVFRNTHGVHTALRVESCVRLLFMLDIGVPVGG
jgi:hypothetical protein